MKDPRAAILAALDADDEQARAAMESWPDLHNWSATVRTAHIAAHDPETVLRRNAGVRAVVEMHSIGGYAAECRACYYRPSECPTIRALADAYAPGWDQ